MSISAGVSSYNNKIYAVIKGSAVNHGGHTPSVTAPNPNQEAELIRDAWKDAGIAPESISYIEAHGTGTKLGDPVEMNALKLAFSPDTQKQNFCAIGSAKAHMGHAEGAAGITGLIKTVLSMNHGEIPAMPGFKNLNPYIDIEDSPFYINNRPVKWETTDHLRCAGVSSFGFGGANAHVVIEEYGDLNKKRSEKQDNPFPRERLLFVLSAKTRERLKTYSGEFRLFLDKNIHDTYEFYNMIYSLQAGREAMPERLAIIVRTRQGLMSKLEDFENGIHREGIFHSGINRSETEQEDRFEGEGLKNRPLTEIARLWVSGEKIDWRLLYPEKRPEWISLPFYPFKRDRYWIPRENMRVVNEDERGAERGDKRKNSIETADSLMDITVEDLAGKISMMLKTEERFIDANSDFSSYGADSIILMELCNIINDQYSIDVKPSILLKYSSIASLAGYLVDAYKTALYNYLKDRKTGSLNNTDGNIAPPQDKCSPLQRLPDAAVTPDIESSKDISNFKSHLIPVNLRRCDSIEYKKSGDHADTDFGFSKIETYVDRNNSIWIYLNNPPANTFSAELMENFFDLFCNVLNKKKFIKTTMIYLTHNGEYFSLGGDRKWFLKCVTQGRKKELRQYTDKLLAIMETQFDLPYIINAVVNGNAQGGGFEIVLSTDFQFTAPSVKLGLPEIKSGIYPGMGGTSYLYSLAGENAAKQLTMTGELITGREANAMGIISHIAENPFDAALNFFNSIPDMATALHIKKRVNTFKKDLLLRDVNDWFEYLWSGNIKKKADTILNNFGFFEDKWNRTAKK